MEEHWAEKKTKAIHSVTADECNPEPVRSNVILLRTARKKLAHSHTQLDSQRL